MANIFDTTKTNKTPASDDRLAELIAVLNSLKSIFVETYQRQILVIKIFKNSFNKPIVFEGLLAVTSGIIAD